MGPARTCGGFSPVAPAPRAGPRRAARHRAGRVSRCQLQALLSGRLSGGLCGLVGRHHGRPARQRKLRTLCAHCPFDARRRLVCAPHLGLGRATGFHVARRHWPSNHDGRHRPRPPSSQPRALHARARCLAELATKQPPRRAARVRRRLVEARVIAVPRLVLDPAPPVATRQHPARHAWQNV